MLFRWYLYNFSFRLVFGLIFGIYWVPCIAEVITLCVFMVSIPHFSKQYPANIMNIVKCDISGYKLLLTRITFFSYLTCGLCYARWLPCLAAAHHATEYWRDAHRIRTGSSAPMSLFIFITSSAGPIVRSNSIGPTEGIMNEYPRNISGVCRNKNNDQINDQNTVSNKYYSTRWYTLT
jgi:hypothetical protein